MSLFKTKKIRKTKIKAKTKTRVKRTRTRRKTRTRRSSVTTILSMTILMMPLQQPMYQQQHQPPLVCSPLLKRPSHQRKRRRARISKMPRKLVISTVSTPTPVTHHMLLHLVKAVILRVVIHRTLAANTAMDSALIVTLASKDGTFVRLPAPTVAQIPKSSAATLVPNNGIPAMSNVTKYRINQTKLKTSRL